MCVCVVLFRPLLSHFLCVQLTGDKTDTSSSGDTVTTPSPFQRQLEPSDLLSFGMQIASGMVSS